MSHDNFWKIIGNSLVASQDEQSKRLNAELSQLSKENLISFEAAYRTKLREAYRWDLWAAAYIINGGCSDDGFDYFCDWLISRGQSVYEAALENPETLIGIATPWDTEFEDFRYVMMDVMSEKHDGEFPESSISRPASPAGEEWDEETVSEKYPKLADWVENTTIVTPPISPSNSQAQGLSFWRRLFGKR